MEWDWEHLARRLMARPIQTDLPTSDDPVPVPWNYGKILDDMDPKELDGWEGEIYGPDGREVEIYRPYVREGGMCVPEMFKGKPYRPCGETERPVWWEYI
ncbi:hypothetical protein NW768_007818 [Fusarium equiseti]|uniref:Uncharacterized protein n=1 Tax=Fusarium equiseti TaxID=61235 RepID=A0ABQ8R8Q5_FUSEQ|nr:hypothetical protein NW768_007818 [Fusarium equiseti]